MTEPAPLPPRAILAVRLAGYARVTPLDGSPAPDHDAELAADFARVERAGLAEGGVLASALDAETVLYFAEVDAAARTAVSLAAALASGPHSVSIGIAANDARIVGGRLVGPSVGTARRLADHAKRHQTVMTRAAFDALPTGGWALEDGQEIHLKGHARPLAIGRLVRL